MTMTFRPVVAGTADVSAIIRIVDSTDGTPETGVVFNTAGIDIRYRRDGATDTAITEATLATLDAAHADGGFLHIGNGYYRVDLPDAACAAGVNGVLVHGTVTGMVVIGTYIPLFAVNPYDTVRMGLTALPNVASGSAGAIPTVGTGTAQISVTGGRATADVTYWNGAVLTGKTGAFPEFGIVDSGTAQSATGTTLVLRSAAAFADDELIGATILIVSATAGAGQRRIITDYVSTTDTATVDTWTTTPSGTIVYAIFGSPPASSGLPVPVNLTQIGGDAQSATDLKDFADAGYDPVTNKVQGVVLTDTATNLTNAPGAGDFTATMKTSIGTAVAASAVASVTGNVGGNVTGSVGSVTGAVGSVTGNVGGNVVGSVGSVTGGATAASLNATRYAKNTASQKVYFTLVDSTDHVTRKTGITVTAQRSLDGAAFGSATGTVTEVGSGVYYLSTSTADINADDVVFRFTGTACDPVELHVVTY